jgi:hypothetical protein
MQLLSEIGVVSRYFLQRNMQQDNVVAFNPSYEKANKSCGNSEHK